MSNRERIIIGIDPDTDRNGIALLAWDNAGLPMRITGGRSGERHQRKSHPLQRNGTICVNFSAEVVVL